MDRPHLAAHFGLFAGDIPKVCAMSENAKDHETQDRRQTAEADKLIPQTQSAIERANEAIKKNQELLDKLKEERESRD